MSNGLSYFKKKAKQSSLTAFISVFFVIYLAGLFALIISHSSSLSVFLKENFLIDIYIMDNAKVDDVPILKKQIEAAPFFQKLIYVSKEDAAQRLEDDLGKDYLDVLGYNPLERSIELYLNAKYVNLDSIEGVKAYLQKNPIVKSVNWSTAVLQFLDSNIKRFGYVYLILSVILLFISIVLISSSIRLDLYSKRFLVKSMQLVGATNGFIKKPFLKKFIVIGLVAGILASVGLIFTLYVFESKFADFAQFRNNAAISLTLVGVILSGALISILSAMFSLNRFLKVRIEDLY